MLEILVLLGRPQLTDKLFTQRCLLLRNEIRDIINNEMSRFGQVFFVHNRVENIYEIANIVQKLVPNAKVTNYGQQKGDLLKKQY